MARIGFVLSGGMAKGAFQLGVLQACKKVLKHEELVAISAASIGCVNGYALATNQLDKMEQIWQELGPSGIHQMARTVWRTSYITRQLEKLFDPTRPVQFAVYACFLNLKDVSLEYIDLQPLSPDHLFTHLQAALCIPAFNEPISMRNSLYVDGAFVDNIPIKPFQQKDLDLIIAIHFDRNLQFSAHRYHDRVIELHCTDGKFLSDSMNFSPEQMKNAIQAGYAFGMKQLRSILLYTPSGELDLPRIYLKIAAENSKKRSHQNLSVDTIFDRTNRVIRLLTRQKILSGEQAKRLMEQNASRNHKPPPIQKETTYRS